MALINSLTSGVTALRSFAKGIEVIGNNIANVNTNGYKSARIDYADTFSDLLSRAAGSDTGAVSGNTNQIGTGVQVAKISSAFTQGAINPTGVFTDLAIQGNGFFKVIDPVSNTEYATRAGSFRVNDAGDLLDTNGFHLQGLNNGAISYVVTEVGGELVFTPTETAPTGVAGNINFTFGLSVGNGLTLDSSVTSFSAAEVEAAAPQLDSLAFDKYGNATMYLSNGDSFVAAKVLLMNFRDPNALVKEGGNLYTNFDAAGPLGGTSTLTSADSAGTNGLGTFQTEAVELSNVDLTQEFANLITTQRSFQAGSRIITVSDDILQEVVNLKR